MSQTVRLAIQVLVLCCVKISILFCFLNFFSIVVYLTAPTAETSNDLSSWVGEELNVSDRPELTSAKVVVSGGTLIKIEKLMCDTKLMVKTVNKKTA